MRSDFRFQLPPELEAPAPPEGRGLRRDQVRLLLIDPVTGEVGHHRFHDLPGLLDPGDLLVVNDSRTLPASLLARTADGQALELRLAGRDPEPAHHSQLEQAAAGAAGAGDRWAALPLGVPPDGGDPALVPTDARPPAPPLPPGMQLGFAGGLRATVLGPHEEAPPLVWLAFDRGGGALVEALHRAGRPVRYAYVPRPWALHHYQTLFAAAPGSVEMASAGRPFTLQTLRELRSRGVGLATISLHAGLSTYGDPEVDRRFVPAEPYRVPAATAEAVARCRAAGGRVVAVGTTVVRTLETAVARGGGRVVPGAGVTRLRIAPGHQLAAVDGLLTGLHEPQASHLDLLGAFVTPAVLHAAYDQALAAGYLWHEFGDVSLILPARRAGGGARPPDADAVRPSR
jgi:S-adenosylmethionine:tRNA ribosyltransferase-isomerase